MTQPEAILDYLKAGNTLTGLDALKLFGTMKLATRISELRDAGHNIKDEWVKNNGKEFKKYWYEEGISSSVSASSFKTQPDLLSVPTIPSITHV